MPYWLGPTYWPLEPFVLLALYAAAFLYLRGQSHRVLRQVRQLRNGWREAAFFAALAAVLVALQSPLEVLARQLFWAHMTQHLILIVVAAPLFAAAAPGFRLWRGLPLGLRRRLAGFLLRRQQLKFRTVVRFLARPASAWVLSTANLWVWHLPPLYDLTLRNHLVHHLEHGLFLSLGILFWMQVIDQTPFQAPLRHLQRAAFVLAAAVQAWILAVVLAFAGAPLYAYAALGARPGGISALTDQQMGAGVMWVPGSITYAIALITFLFLWLQEEDRGGAVPATRSRRA